MRIIIQTKVAYRLKGSYMISRYLGNITTCYIKYYYSHFHDILSKTITKLYGIVVQPIFAERHGTA